MIGNCKPPSILWETSKCVTVDYLGQQMKDRNRSEDKILITKVPSSINNYSLSMEQSTS